MRLSKALSIGTIMVAVMGFTAAARAQLNITSNTTYTIDFDNTVTGVNNGAYSAGGFTNGATTAGQLDSNAWATTGMSDGATAFGGNSTGGDFGRATSTGGVSTGGFYSFDVSNGGTPDYAFGFQATGSDFTPGTITLKIVNNTGQTITGFDLGYIFDVYNDADRGNTFNFAFSSDGSSFTDVSSLNYAPTPLEAAADASPMWVANNRNLSFSSSSTANFTGINDGSAFYLQWKTDDFSGSGSRDEYALNDISLSNFTLNSGAAAYPDKLVWDTADNGGGVIDEGSGTWNTSNTNWNNNLANVAYDSSKTAEFGNGTSTGVSKTPATVTLSEPITAANVHFAASDTQYTLTGSPLTVSGDVIADQSAEIASDLHMAGSGNSSTITVNGADTTLTLSGALSGDFKIASSTNGRIVVNNANAGFNGSITIDPIQDIIFEVAGGASTGTASIINTGYDFTAAGVKFTGNGTIGGVFDSEDTSNSVSGNLTITGDASMYGGTITPGTLGTKEAGHVTFGSLTHESTFIDYDWNLTTNTENGTGAAGSDWDLLTIGSLSKVNSAATIDLNIDLAGSADINNFNDGALHQWTVASGSFSLSDFDVFAVSPTSGSASDWSLTLSGNDLLLNYQHAGGVATPPDVVINEIDPDNPGTDTSEFVELYDGGVGNTSLDGTVLVFFNGNGNTSYAAFDLTGYSTDANGFFVLGDTALGMLVNYDIGASNIIQNGEDGIALIFGSASNFPNGTPVSIIASDGYTLIDGIVYGTNDPDATDLIAALGGPQYNDVDTDGSGVATIGRLPNFSGSFTTINNNPTPGALNFVPTSVPSPMALPAGLMLMGIAAMRRRRSA